MRREQALVQASISCDRAASIVGGPGGEQLPPRLREAMQALLRNLLLYK
eukprot:gene34608-34127_t